MADAARRNYGIPKNPAAGPSDAASTGPSSRIPGSPGSRPAGPQAAAPGRSESTGAEPGSQATSRSVLAEADIARIVSRMAHQILEKTSGGAEVVLLGIQTRGVPLAQRLAGRIRDVEGVTVPTGSLDPTMYRDDLRLKAVRPLRVTDIPDGGIDGRVVILVDDVLYSGRTVRAALDALAEYGRPRAVQLAVLVDRGHRELPIRADYVGKNMPTSRRETVAVRLAETDGSDEVLILGAQP